MQIVTLVGLIGCAGVASQPTPELLPKGNVPAGVEDASLQGWRRVEIANFSVLRPPEGAPWEALRALKGSPGFTLSRHLTPTRSLVISALPLTVAAYGTDSASRDAALTGALNRLRGGAGPHPPGYLFYEESRFTFAGTECASIDSADQYRLGGWTARRVICLLPGADTSATNLESGYVFVNEAVDPQSVSPEGEAFLRSLEFKKPTATAR